MLSLLSPTKTKHYCFPFKTCRCEAFHIGRKSRFDVKSMAGNIIPAIATTNAEIGGLIVQEALKILGGGVENIRRLCRTVRRGEKRIYYSRFESLHVCKLFMGLPNRTFHSLFTSKHGLPFRGEEACECYYEYIVTCCF